MGVFFKVLLLVALALFSPVNMAQDEKVVRFHHEDMKGCVACHQEGDAELFRKATSTACLECHKQKGVRTDLGKALKQMEAQLEAAILTTKPLQRAEGQGPGMSVPIYYEKSRIGAEPNAMVHIPAGKFIRGTDYRLPDEGPRHEVTLPGYYIDKYEVTNLQYKKFIDATKRRSPDHFVNRTFPEGKADHPVTFVSWFDAKEYCEWTGKRLPDDKEWEKAARGGDGRVFPWGSEFSIDKANTPVRWAALNLKGDTTPVGAFEGGKSPYGLYDMTGNVWEWTSSWYEPYPGNKRITENYGEKYKVLKGGSWWDCSFYKCGISAPVFNRSFFHPRTKNESFGFRCASDKPSDKQVK
ncbi:MAG: SUMF1/EgtB/PvdO family nonheme iron enzyme [Pseudomonadota bacterium]|nr:SUMF1/EgtB/PvdO family nonheme iron enzyme [Pseudomonadota bacterium]